MESKEEREEKQDTIPINEWFAANKWDDLGRFKKNNLNRELSKLCNLGDITPEEYWNQCNKQEKLELLEEIDAKGTLSLNLPAIFHKCSIDKFMEYRSTYPDGILLCATEYATQVALIRLGEVISIEGAFNCSRNGKWKYFPCAQYKEPISIFALDPCLRVDYRGLLTLALEHGSLVFPKKEHAITTSDTYGLTTFEIAMNCIRGLVTIINRSKLSELKATAGADEKGLPARPSIFYQPIPTHNLTWDKLTGNLQERLKGLLEKRTASSSASPEEYWNLANREQRGSILEELHSKLNSQTSSDCKQPM